MPVQLLNVDGFSEDVSLKNANWFVQTTLNPTTSFFKECPKCFLLKNAVHGGHAALQNDPRNPFLENTSPLILQLKFTRGLKRMISKESQNGYSCIPFFSCSFGKEIYFRLYPAINTKDRVANDLSQRLAVPKHPDPAPHFPRWVHPTDEEGWNFQ